MICRNVSYLIVATFYQAIFQATSLVVKILMITPAEQELEL